ncbi:hypothetical protein MJD09_23225, partial [bacterium]|nr:hypothetical protein [bacterium]
EDQKAGNSLVDAIKIRFKRQKAIAILKCIGPTAVAPLIERLSNTANSADGLIIEVLTAITGQKHEKKEDWVKWQEKESN